MKKIFFFQIFFYVSGFCIAQSPQPLFVIERNTNGNRVYYDAMVNADSLLDTRQPIHAYWVMWQKDPTGKTREELNLLEKQKGFGFKVQQTPERKFIWFNLVSLPSRSIKVSIVNGAAIAECVINGRFSIIQKVFINVVEKNFLPHVNYIELFGKDYKSGEEIYEKVVNKSK